MKATGMSACLHMIRELVSTDVIQLDDHSTSEAADGGGILYLWQVSKHSCVCHGTSVNGRNDGIERFADFLIWGLYALEMITDVGVRLLRADHGLLKALIILDCIFVRYDVIEPNTVSLQTTTSYFLLAVKTFAIGHYKQSTITYHHQSRLPTSKHTSSKATVSHRPSIGHDSPRCSQTDMIEYIIYYIL